MRGCGQKVKNMTKDKKNHKMDQKRNETIK